MEPPPEAGRGVAEMSRRRALQGLAVAAGSLAMPMALGAPAVAGRLSWGSLADDVVEQIRSLGVRTLALLVPDGSQSNLAPIVRAFGDRTGVQIEQQVVAVRDMSTRMVLEHRGGVSRFDVALPATFELADLVSAGVVAALDDYVDQYEPTELADRMLYSSGSRHLGRFYGYQTDGDCYLMFLNRALLADPAVRHRVEDQLGVDASGADYRPQTWAEIDALMAAVADPSAQRFGGNLFRTPGYLVWEFLLRLYASGVAPLSADLTPLIDSDAGVRALEALLAASKSQDPAVASDQLFGNWASYAQGNSLINIGWGGSQKSFRRAGKFADGISAFLPPSPGGGRRGMAYFNWGWNYCVSARSEQPLAAYLFTLFATAPDISTAAVRAPGGYFDPYLKDHYTDHQIQQTYSHAFLDVHQDAMSRCVPDMYLIGQGEYFGSLSTLLELAYQGQLSAQEALRFASQDWRRLNARYGAAQLEVWDALRAKHPPGIIG